MPAGTITADPRDISQPPIAGAQTITVDPADLDQQPGSQVRSAISANARTITVDPSELDQPSSSGTKSRQNAPPKSYSLSDLGLPGRTAIPSRNPLIPAAAEPDVDELKKKYGLPQEVNLTKGFFDPANLPHMTDAGQMEDFSKAFQELQSYSTPQPPQTLSGSLVDEGKNLFKAATAPPDSPFSATEVPLIGGPVTQFTDPLMRAREDAKQGKYGTAAIEAAGAVPLVGPMITARGEDIAQGRYRRAAGAGLADVLALAPMAAADEPSDEGAFGSTLDRAKAASEPIVQGNTVPDYLANVRGRIADQIAQTGRRDRINAPVNLPRVPETTEPPVVVPPRPPRTSMQELSEQAAEARRPQEFRQQLTEDIADQIERRLRDEGLLEEPQSNVLDRRVVRPEDVQPYQPPRRFIGTPSGQTAVVPRADQVAPMLRTGLRAYPEETAPVARRALPPVPQETLDRIQLDRDVRQAAGLYVGRIQDPVEREYAANLWKSMQQGTPAPEMPSNVRLRDAVAIRNKLTSISQGDIPGRVPNPRTVYPQDILDEARQMMDWTHSELSQQERAGRRMVNLQEDSDRKPDWVAQVNRSAQRWFPWFENLRESPSDLAKAMERGQGPAYDRLLTSAADYITKSRQEFRDVALSVEPDLASLAEQVRGIDPDLADFLRDAAQGKVSTWIGRGNRLANIEEKIANARAAVEFSRAVDDLAAEERNESGAQESGRTAGTAGGEASERPADKEGTPELRRGEAGFATPDMARDLLSGRLLKDAYRQYVANPIIEKGLGLGDKYGDVEKTDPKIAAGLHLLDNAPAYFRAKGAQTVHSIIGNLSRQQERLFTLMADADSRENLQKNHPEEYRQGQNDPAIQAALAKYRPVEQALTAARQRLGAATLDRDYLRRVYDQHVAGIGKAEAPGTGERATTAFDRVIQPQTVKNLSREATAEYHYQNGLHEFGPAFGTKFVATNLRGLENEIARDFISKATEIEPRESQPRSITYNGEKYYRPDVARDMRAAGLADVKTYDMYDPNAGVKYPAKGGASYLGPQEIVRALNDHGTERDTTPGPVRRFLQEQTIGFGFGLPHVANILRRVTQSAPLGALNPEAWARAWRVAFGSDLRARGMKGLDDPTFDKLMQQGSITTGEQTNLKAYWGGNLNPTNWARSLAGIGHRLIFEPGSFGGFGGIDQRARLYVADLVKSQNPDLSDAQIARAVNTQLGDYNRLNWNARQKLVSKFMLFPGWDTSSIRWVIQHPIKTTVPPAILILTANQVLNRLGYNRDEDARDISNIHFGDRSIGMTILRESMARNLARPALNYAQSRINGENNQRALGEAARGIGQAAGGLVGTLRPDLTAGIGLAMNRESPFGGQELVTKDDWNAPGRVLPNRALEKQATLVLRHAVPELDRMIGSDQSVDFAGFAGSNVGLPNYKYGAGERLKRNTAEAAEVSETLSRLAKTNRASARQFVADPENAAYAVFHNDFDRMSKTLARIDEATQTVNSAKNLSAADKQERLAQIDHARQNLLRNADGLDRLLFERQHKGKAANQ